MPERAIIRRDPISREGGVIAGANGLSLRPAISRPIGDRTITDQPAAPPMSAAEIARISGLVQANAWPALAPVANVATSTTPTNPGVIVGPSDPFDTLSDVFRSVFGSDAANQPNGRQQALTPVTTGGGGGSGAIWILLILGIGVAVYFYRNR